MGIIGAFFAIVAIVIAILLLSYPLIGLDKIFAIEAKEIRNFNISRQKLTADTLFEPAVNFVISCIC